MNKPEDFDEIKKGYLKYQQKGIELHSLDCVMAKARVLINVDKKYAEARELWASYKGDHNYDSLVLATFAYLSDPDEDSEKGSPNPRTKRRPNP